MEDLSIDQTKLPGVKEGKFPVSAFALFIIFKSQTCHFSSTLRTLNARLHTMLFTL